MDVKYEKLSEKGDYDPNEDTEGREVIYAETIGVLLLFYLISLCCINDSTNRICPMKIVNF